jgi:acetyl-CoA carboxylase biotin carboxyl carrier protein
MTEEIKAQTTGKVWKIETLQGAKLEEDDVIMILESMKMEIPVFAPKAGTLVAILVSEGDSVADGQVVATIE